VARAGPPGGGRAATAVMSGYDLSEPHRASPIHVQVISGGGHPAGWRVLARRVGAALRSWRGVNLTEIHPSKCKQLCCGVLWCTSVSACGARVCSRAARRHVSYRSPMSPPSCGTLSPHEGGEVALPPSIAMAAGPRPPG
jgi:hypothetical protein